MLRFIIRFLFVIALAALVAGGYLFYKRGRAVWHPVLQTLTGKPSLDEVLERFGAETEERLQIRFAAAEAPYPPDRITLIGLKDEDRLELWADADGRRYRVHSYDVLAASGVAGPKLREGDLQVPEGDYRIEYLNPNSSYHLSMKIDYPNAFDRAQARREGRTNLGGDIFIHGKNVSIGCLAIGDPAIEELFYLVSKIGKEKVRVIVAPYDLRTGRRPPLERDLPDWTRGLYDALARELADYGYITP